MFAQCADRHTSFAQRTSLGVANIICRRQTSFKKRTFVGRQKCVFCWRRVWDSRTRSSRIMRRCTKTSGSANNIQIASNLEASSPFSPTKNPNAPRGHIGIFGGGCGIRTHVPVKANGFQEVYQRIPFQLSSVQFRLKQFPKILILQGFSGLFGTDMN